MTDQSRVVSCHSQAEAGDITWVKAALDSGADMMDRGGKVCSCRKLSPVPCVWQEKSDSSLCGEDVDACSVTHTVWKDAHARCG